MAELTAPMVFAGTCSGGVTEPDWTLLDVGTWNDDRIFERYIRFDRRFSSAPIVHVGLVGFDIDNTINARLQVSAQNITGEGFTLQIRTWLNSRMWSVEVSWMAVGNARV